MKIKSVAVIIFLFYLFQLHLKKLFENEHKKLLEKSI